MKDLTQEIKLQTTRSGGKGGQNVNKVETAVIAYLDVQASQILSEDEKNLVLQKLSNRINASGELLARSQAFRSQLENKEDAIAKINDLVTAALKKKKMRIGTKPSKKAREKRLEQKKHSSDLKQGRKKFNPRDF